MHRSIRNAAAAAALVIGSLSAVGTAQATSYAAPPPAGGGGGGGGGEQYAEQSFVTTNVNLRAGPGTNHGVIAQLRRGDFVNVGQCQGAWCPVQAGGQPNGWVSGRFIGRGENPYHSRGPAGPGVPPQEPGTYR